MCLGIKSENTAKNTNTYHLQSDGNMDGEEPRKEKETPAESRWKTLELTCERIGFDLGCWLPPELRALLSSASLHWGRDPGWVPPPQRPTNSPSQMPSTSPRTRSEVTSHCHISVSEWCGRPKKHLH